MSEKTERRSLGLVIIGILLTYGIWINQETKGIVELKAETALIKAKSKHENELLKERAETRHAEQLVIINNAIHDLQIEKLK